MNKKTIHDLNENVILGIYDGLSRSEESDPIYLDYYTFDVGTVIQGYFSSNIKNQEIANRELMNKIQFGAPKDDIDPSRYIIIYPIYLPDFIKEFVLMSKNKEPYISFAKEFCEKIEEVSSYDLREIEASYYVQEKFASDLMTKYKENIEQISDFNEIYNNTRTNLSITWAVENLSMNEPYKHEITGKTWNM